MKYVLVTGGTSSLGKEIINIFASNNYNIIVGYHNKYDAAIELCKSIKSKYNVDCIVNKLDITSEYDVKQVFNDYDIDILINNAAYCLDNDIMDKSFDEFMDVVRVNLGGTFLMCKYASNTNTIINIASRDGIDTYNPISLDYSSSKAGIINLSKNLSILYKNKKIYCVCPGWIDTDSVMEMNPSYLCEELKRIGQKLLLKKESVASKIFNLVDSELESGSVVIIDEYR